MILSVPRSLSIACSVHRVGARSCFSGFGSIGVIRLKHMQMRFQHLGDICPSRRGGNIMSAPIGMNKSGHLTWWPTRLRVCRIVLLLSHVFATRRANPSRPKIRRFWLRSILTSPPWGSNCIHRSIDLEAGRWSSFVFTRLQCAGAMAFVGDTHVSCLGRGFEVLRPLIRWSCLEFLPSALPTSGQEGEFDAVPVRHEYLSEVEFAPVGFPMFPRGQQHIA